MKQQDHHGYETRYDLPPPPTHTDITNSQAWVLAQAIKTLRPNQCIALTMSQSQTARIIAMAIGKQLITGGHKVKCPIPGMVWAWVVEA